MEIYPAYFFIPSLLFFFIGFMVLARFRRKAEIALTNLRKAFAGPKENRKFYRKLLMAQATPDSIRRLSKQDKFERIAGIGFWIRRASDRIDLSTAEEILVRQEHSFDGKFSEAIDKFIKEPNDIVVVDLGAHIGIWSLWTNKLLERNGKKAGFICFEPNPENLRLLKKNIALHKINADIRQEAITNREKETDFYFDKVVSTGGSVNRRRRLKEKIRVKGKTMNSLSNEIKGNSNIILKFDIEGAEQDAVEQGKELIRRAKIVQGEYHFPRGEEKRAQKEWIKFRTFLEENFKSVAINEKLRKGGIHFTKTLNFLACN